MANDNSILIIFMCFAGFVFLAVIVRFIYYCIIDMNVLNNIKNRLISLLCCKSKSYNNIIEFDEYTDYVPEDDDNRTTPYYTTDQTLKINESQFSNY